jgi:hypothetical protein
MTQKRTINLKTFEGELIYLVGLAVQTNKEMGLNKNILPILDEMATENYAQTIQVFDREFGEYFSLIYK